MPGHKSFKDKKKNHRILKLALLQRFENVLAVVPNYLWLEQENGHYGPDSAKHAAKWN